MAVAPSKLLMTAVACWSRPGTTSGRAWLNVVARAALVSALVQGGLVANVTVCRPAVGLGESR